MFTDDLAMQGAMSSAGLILTKFSQSIPGSTPEGLTHWGRDKMDAISQTTYSSAFSWMKMYELRLKVHWPWVTFVPKGPINNIPALV